MSRKKLIAANWKMHKTIGETGSFCEELKSSLPTLPECDILVCPPFLSVPAAVAVVADTDIAIGAQDLFYEEQGAYTGEVSGRMIVDTGATHVLVGHSERRHVIGESDAVVGRKLRAALDAGLTPVFCVGEKIEQREAGEAEPYVRAQMESALADLQADDFGRVVVAYEPVWAIGTGRTATPDDADEMHRFVRRFVGDRFGAATAETVRILYGGSVKPDNAASLLGRDNIDGALIGGASLEVESFLAIAGAVY